MTFKMRPLTTSNNSSNLALVWRLRSSTNPAATSNKRQHSAKRRKLARLTQDLACKSSMKNYLVGNRRGVVLIIDSKCTTLSLVRGMAHRCRRRIQTIVRHFKTSKITRRCRQLSPSLQTTIFRFKITVPVSQNQQHSSNPTGCNTNIRTKICLTTQHQIISESIKQLQFQLKPIELTMMKSDNRKVGGRLNLRQKYIAHLRDSFSYQFSVFFKFCQALTIIIFRFISENKLVFSFKFSHTFHSFWQRNKMILPQKSLKFITINY